MILRVGSIISLTWTHRCQRPVLNDVKDQRPLPLISRALRHGFEPCGGSHHWVGADALRAPRTEVLGWCVTVRGVAYLACDRARLNSLPLVRQANLVLLMRCKSS